MPVSQWSIEDVEVLSFALLQPYFDLIVNSIVDCPTFLPTVSSTVNCNV